MGEVYKALDRLTGETVALKRVIMPNRAMAAVIPGDDLAKTHWAQGMTLSPDSSMQAQMLKPWDMLPAQSSDSARQAATMSGLEAAGGSLTSASLKAPGQLSRPLGLAETLAIPVADKAAYPEAKESGSATSAVHTAQLRALRLHLTQEFRTLASLRHPHIVSVLDYGFDHHHQPYFTMELLDGAIPLDKAAYGQPFPVKVSLLLQSLQALTYLHRRGVLHRDIKLSNILVISSPHGPHVKLLDFGLAVLARQQKNEDAEVAGTIGYIAPEILVGAQPSEASDLFAVGVMAHELLVGAHPLGKQTPSELIKSFLGAAPIFSEDERVGSQLSSVLRRALARSPGDRYHDAATFGHELACAGGLPIPVETVEIRESFLQSAAFVAREQELSTLHRALDSAASGHGSIWLVGGESGVGKSRLLDELRTLALVRGTQVVRGQAIGTGGIAYQVWQGALRPLCLDAAINELDASVLRAVIPDIAMLLGRAVSDPPALAPQNAQARLLWTVEKLLLSQREPLLILLEDLQWAEPASIAVLQRLSRSVQNHPLLVVASYRQDERPAFPDELPDVQSINLRRLSAEQLVMLSTSMLGETGRRADIVGLLERETEGNAFFIVEVIRSLAEDVGSLDKIGISGAPAKVTAGGVQAVLARRLARVPDPAKPLLCAAAVFGRELDLEVLHALQDNLGAQADSHLAACAALSVLEVNENRWRFAHDKLRDAVLAGLPGDARSHWHRLVAEAIERAYAQELAPHLAALGYHFDQAGDAVRALPYRLQAGERATRNGAVHEAIMHLERAREVQNQVPCSDAERAHAKGLLCRAYQEAGRAQDCMLILEQLFADAGFTAPRSAPKLFMEIAILCTAHARFRLAMWAQQPLGPPFGKAWTHEVVDAVVAAGEVIALTRAPAQVVYLVLATAAIAERLHAPLHIAAAYSWMAYCLSATPLRQIAESYIQQAHRLLGQVPDPPLSRRANVKTLECVLRITGGDWELANQCLMEELEERRSIGDWRQEMFALLQGTAIELWRGAWPIAQGYLQSIDRIAHRVDIAQYIGWARTTFAMLAIHEGRFPAAEEFLREAELHEASANEPSLRVMLLAHWALYWVRIGDAQKARAKADSALDLLRSSMPFSYSLVDALHSLVEVYFGMWITAPKGAAQAELHKHLKESLSLLRTVSVIFPICRARGFLWHGRYAARHGHERLAKWLLLRALQAAEQRRMPLDQALSHQFLADLADQRGERRLAIKERRAALLLYQRLGAHWYTSQLVLRERAS